MYMWHSVPGYSKIGSYSGNGSSDGVYVKLGFKPAWLLVKRVIGSGNGWTIVDNKRNPTNSMDKQLYPNLNYADSTYEVDVAGSMLTLCLHTVSINRTKSSL